MNLFNSEIASGQSIEQLERLEDGTFRLISNTGDIHLTKTIIITAGNGAFQPRRLNVGESETFEGTNLYYYVKDINKFKNRRVAILGGGDSAVDWALMLEKIASEVTLVHRRDDFRAHEHSVNQLNKSMVQKLTPFTTASIVATNRIEKLTLQEKKGKN